MIEVRELSVAYLKKALLEYVKGITAEVENQCLGFLLGCRIIYGTLSLNVERYHVV